MSKVDKLEMVKQLMETATKDMLDRIEYEEAKLWWDTLAAEEERMNKRSVKSAESTTGDRLPKDDV